MIRYALKCSQGHGFESWFRDSGTFENQAGAAALSCPVCGVSEVSKAVMAPAVPGRTERPALSAPGSEAEVKLAELRRKIETTSDYVGPDFAAEARRMHEGASEHRAIWGEASRDEAKALHRDGIPALPIPWMNRRDD